MTKILLAGDTELLSPSEELMLKNRGIEIFATHSGREAIEIHRRQKVNIILCDPSMRDLKAEEFCSIIRKDDELKKVSILIVAAGGLDLAVSACLAAGGNDYIIKPVNGGELLRKLGKYAKIPVRSDTRLLVRLQVGGVSGRSEIFAGMTRNISSSGFLLETNHKFIVGDSAEFHISLFGFSAKVPVRGEIAREAADVEPEKSYYGVKMNFYGVRFMDVSSQLKDYLEDFVESQTPH